MDRPVAATAPCVLGLTPSFGFGDRIGMATPGHVAAMQAAGNGIAPIFAQQSVREMERTGRNPAGVLRDAQAGMQKAGWAGDHGADADHLREPADVEPAARAGFTFFTLDPSAHVDPGAGGYPEDLLRERFAAVRDRVGWVLDYVGRTVPLPDGSSMELDEETCLRAAVKYGLAIEHACTLASVIEHHLRDRHYEIELSVDETEEPTSLAEHFIIADQCRVRDMKLVSLAPRFVGSLEKGIDYKGDLAALERSLTAHAHLARTLGPYKLSLHSGSDKLSMYSLLAQATAGCFHVKTAGTSYLEALRVVARHDAGLFRRIVAFARERYEADRVSYELSAGLADAPPPDAEIEVTELERAYLGQAADVPPGRGFTTPGRQIVHCTYGSVLADPDLGQALFQLLKAHPETHAEFLCGHFTQHLIALR